MKKLGSLLFSMLIGMLMAQAQLTLNITGDVLNGATGVPYHNVNLLINSGFFSYTDSVLTDSAGFFSFNPVLSPGATQGLILVSTLDCNNNLLVDSAGFTPGTTSANFLFNYCGSGGGCSNNFTYQTNPGNGVSFFSSTTGSSPSTYYWDFGDGTTGTLANPVHTYNAIGTYNVCLITTDNLGCIDTTCKSVSLNNFPACSAVFTYFGNGLTNQFQFISDTTLNQTASLNWDFGDGNTSQSPFPTYTYASPGTYVVCLTAVDTSLACVDSFCTTIVVGSGNCQAGFTTANVQGNTWSFTNTSTGGSPMNPLSYTWVFGDGTSSTVQNPVHSFTNAGVYNVCLVINDNMGCIDSTCAIITIGSGNNCNAFFTSFGTGGSTLFSFEADSSTNSPFATYSWDFGDNSLGGGIYVSHVYNAPGVYTVCLTVNDSITNCTSTYCDSIVVGNTPSCQAGFNVTANQGSLNVFFTNTSIGGSILNPLTYQWDFGDGGFSTQQNPSHTYASAGTYTVCLVILDNMGCTDTICVPITIVGGGNNCNALFTATNTGTGTFVFLADSSGNDPNASYLWDFGDNTAGNGLTVSHTYSPGFYLACLTVIDSLNNCVATYCDTLSIQSPGTYNINGNVFSDSNFVYNGIAYLIVHDTINGTLTAIDSVAINQSFYTFFNVNPGSYLVKAALTSGSPNYSSYLPTYLGDVLFWSSATSTIVTNSNISLPTIYLVPGVNSGGPGFIGGLISQGANKGPGDPLSDVLVLITDENDNPVSYTYTNANGEYEFSNLAYGTYKIYVEIAGKYSDYWTVTISGDNQMYENADFEVGDTQINTVGTSIDKFTFGEILGIYPNPAKDMIQVNVEFTEPSELSIELLNMVGQTIDRQDPGMVFGNQSFQFQLSTLPQGTYLIKLQSDNQIITKRIIKRN